MKKESIKQFFIWFRNGVSVCVLWFLILLLLRNYTLGIEEIKTDTVFKLILTVAGGVFGFCICFLPTLIKRWHFQTRLTTFMVFISIYECVCFYWLGIFQTKGTLGQYTAFVGIVLGCYLVSLGIYGVYSRKRGDLYTNALKKYQEKISG